MDSLPEDAFRQAVALLCPIYGDKAASADESRNEDQYDDSPVLEPAEQAQALRTLVEFALHHPTRVTSTLANEIMPTLLSMCHQGCSSDADLSGDDSDSDPHGSFDMYDADDEEPDGCYALMRLAEEAVCAWYHAAPDVTYRALLTARANVSLACVDLLFPAGDVHRLLFWACESGCARIVSWLAHRPEVDLEVQDTDGGTPLLHACRFRRIRVIEALVRAGAEPCVRNLYGAHPFQSRACRRAMEAAMTARRDETSRWFRKHDLQHDCVIACPRGRAGCWLSFCSARCRRRVPPQIWVRGPPRPERCTRPHDQTLPQHCHGHGLTGTCSCRSGAPTVSSRELVHLLVAQWKALGAQTQQEYRAKAEAEKMRWQQQLAERQRRARALSRFDEAA